MILLRTSQLHLTIKRWPLNLMNRCSNKTKNLNLLQKTKLLKNRKEVIKFHKSCLRTSLSLFNQTNTLSISNHNSCHITSLSFSKTVALAISAISEVFLHLLIRRTNVSNQFNPMDPNMMTFNSESGFNNNSRPLTTTIVSALITGTHSMISHQDKTIIKISKATNQTHITTGTSHLCIVKCHRELE